MLDLDFKKEHIGSIIPESFINLFEYTFGNSAGLEEGAMLKKLVKEMIAGHQADQLKIFSVTHADQLIGSVFFSPLIFKSHTGIWLLSPMAVKPTHQKQGIGQALIRYAIESLKSDGVLTIVTYGDSNFYSKIGFSALEETVIEAPLKLSYPSGWLGLSLIKNSISPIYEKPRCIEALNHADYW